MSCFYPPLIPWGVSAPVGKMRKQLLKDHNFLNSSPIFIIWNLYFWYICFSRSDAYNAFQFEKLFWIWWKVLDTKILWQDVGPCCEQTHAAFEVGLSLDQGQGVYSGSAQVRLCHTCIIDVMSIIWHSIWLCSRYFVTSIASYPPCSTVGMDISMWCRHPCTHFFGMFNLRTNLLDNACILYLAGVDFHMLIYTCNIRSVWV